jgi:hypothetical protein
MVGLLDLPDSVLQIIVGHVLCLGPDAELRPGSRGLRAAVLLARTHPQLRRAAGEAVRQLRFTAGAPAWPAARALGPIAPTSLEVVDVAINRSCFIGFLRWLAGGAGELRVLHLRVVGLSYDRDALCDLEKMLLGRLFTRTGHAIQSLVVSGIDAGSLLVTVCCRCTSLRRFELRRYDATNPSPSVPHLSPINVCLCLITCLVNRDHLQRVRLPTLDFGSMSGAGAEGMDGSGASDMLENVWAAMWGNYRAGVKEAAANLAEDGSELAAFFRTVSHRMDDVDSSMRDTLLRVRDIAPRLGKDALPLALLANLAPLLSDVHLKLLEARPVRFVWPRLSAIPALRILRFQESGSPVAPEDIMALKTAFPCLIGLFITFKSPKYLDFIPLSPEASTQHGSESHWDGWDRIRVVVNALCLYFGNVLRHLGLAVSGLQDPLFGLSIEKFLMAAPPVIEFLSLSYDGCYEVGSLSALLYHQGATMRQCRLCSGQPDHLDIVLARRQVFLVFAKYCNPSNIDEVLLPTWMQADEEAIEQEWLWALEVAPKLSLRPAGDDVGDTVDTLRAATYSVPFTDAVGTFQSGTAYRGVPHNLHAKKIIFVA